MASVFPTRPKGMHHRTYERLKSDVLHAEILAEERLVIALARLQWRERQCGSSPLPKTAAGWRGGSPSQAALPIP